MSNEEVNSAEKGGSPQDWTRREMKGLPAGLDALWTQKSDEGWRYAIKLDESHANAQGMIHGGVMMTFLDHALSLLIWEKSGRAICSTVQLDSHFLSAVKPPAFLELDAEIIKQGKKMAFVRGRLRQGDKIVMEATGVWSISQPRPPA